MGREIVYCSRCAMRLSGDAVETPWAGRWGLLCSACTPASRGRDPFSGEENPERPGAATDLLPGPSSSDRRKNKALLATLGIAGACALLGLIATWALQPGTTWWRALDASSAQQPRTQETSAPKEAGLEKPQGDSDHGARAQIDLEGAATMHMNRHAPEGYVCTSCKASAPTRGALGHRPGCTKPDAVIQISAKSATTPRMGR